MLHGVSPFKKYHCPYFLNLLVYYSALLQRKTVWNQLLRSKLKKKQEVSNMNSETLLSEALGYLEELERVFADLASRSEHQVQRSDYINFQGQIQEIQRKLSQDLDNIDDTETFTMSLDRW